ncbi:hypothetical protein B0H13DRAFT_2267457 [Mycena leptocephala]|nr:hypothetical protein B0H13DRAFT_2267457 [Mycena leptocephala]
MTMLPPLLVFPPELERELFEICALSRPVSIPKLMLVAHHVKEWYDTISATVNVVKYPSQFRVEPLLYRIMTLGPFPPFINLAFFPSFRGFPEYPVDVMLRAVAARPPAFFDAAARHLMIWWVATRGEDVEKILAVCTGVQDLSVLQIPDSWLQPIASFPLRRVYIDSASFMRLVSAEHELRWQLMHLNISEAVRDANAVCAALISLPHLTHLSFWQTALIPMCPQLLKSCTSLRVLLCRTSDARYQMEYAVLTQNVRFVLFGLVLGVGNFSLADWHTGARGGADLWSRVELFIDKRRSREIDPLHHHRQ